MDSFLIRPDRREILRATAFLSNTPFAALRCNSGWAATKAALAAAASPLAIASSTFFTAVRAALRRAIFIVVTFALRMIRALDDLWLAIVFKTLFMRLRPYGIVVFGQNVKPFIVGAKGKSRFADPSFGGIMGG